MSLLTKGFKLGFIVSIEFILWVLIDLFKKVYLLWV
ncbi:unnamed protein product [Brassica oleracea]